MITWKAKEFLSATRAQLVKNFTRAGVFFTSKVRGYLNVSQPYTRSASGRHHGQAPSAPHDFPRKLSGELQRSVSWNLDSKRLVLSVGSNLKGYPSFLQTGTRFMQARPWLTLSFDKDKATIGKILIGKK